MHCNTQYPRAYWIVSEGIINALQSGWKTLDQRQISNKNFCWTIRFFKALAHRT
jgi:hypothetical protein